MKVDEGVKEDESTGEVRRGTKEGDEGVRKGHDGRLILSSSMLTKR